MRVQRSLLFWLKWFLYTTTRKTMLCGQQQVNPQEVIPSANRLIVGLHQNEKKESSGAQINSKKSWLCAPRMLQPDSASEWLTTFRWSPKKKKNCINSRMSWKLLIPATDTLCRAVLCYYFPVYKNKNEYKSLREIKKQSFPCLEDEEAKTFYFRWRRT